MASSESVETSNNDLISNMPALVMDNILRHLPISVAAKTSILSRSWRSMWLSCQYLSFDDDFWDGFCKSDGCTIDWQRGSRTISSILFHHTGCVYSFRLCLKPDSAKLLTEKNASLSQWLSLLSRNCPKKISLKNPTSKWSNLIVMPSYIFHCTKLTRLELKCFILNAPPFDFKGFHHLTSLELRYVIFKHSFVAKCPCLVSLKLESCFDKGGVLHIEAKGLEKLILRSAFNSFSLEKSTRLKDVSLSGSIWSHKSQLKDIETVSATVKTLARSQQLRCLEIAGELCKLLAGGGIVKSLPVALNHLNRLVLSDLMLSDSDVFCFILGIVRRCPFIEDLQISIKPASKAALQEYEYCSNDYRLSRLQMVKITGITGTSVELKLIEYVLSISVVLENLFIKCETSDAVSQLEVLRQVTVFPRASTKAQIVSLEV